MKRIDFRYISGITELIIEMIFMSHVFCQQIQIDQLEAIKIEHPLFSATLLLQGAQLIEFTPSNESDNLLWLSDTVEYKQGKPLRGGIPICWPWFGNLDQNPTTIQKQVQYPSSASAHGFARSQPWEIKHINEDCQFVEVILILTSNPETKALWPFDFELEATFRFSKTLKLTLTTTNTGNEPFSISQALHSYLPTEDINRSYIHDTHNTTYIDALDDWKEKKQTGRISFSEETDRLYFFTNNHYSLRLETPNQTLLIHNENSQSAVIWNPWSEKSKRLSQFSPQDFHHMLCIETANVLSDIKKIDAGQQTEISVEFLLNV
jgi:glucose-6-phosphate 1-epimerase